MVKTGRKRLQIDSADLVVLAESSIKVMHQVFVNLLSTNLVMHTVVRLIHVRP